MVKHVNYKSRLSRGEGLSDSVFKTIYELESGTIKNEKNVVKTVIVVNQMYENGTFELMDIVSSSICRQRKICSMLKEVNIELENGAFVCTGIPYTFTSSSFKGIETILRMLEYKKDVNTKVVIDIDEILNTSDVKHPQALLGLMLFLEPLARNRVKQLMDETLVLVFNNKVTTAFEFLCSMKGNKR